MVLFVAPRVFNYMICSDEKLDAHRFKDIIDEALAAGLVLSVLLLLYVDFVHLPCCTS